MFSQTSYYPLSASKQSWFPPHQINTASVVAGGATKSLAVAASSGKKEQIPGCRCLLISKGMALTIFSLFRLGTKQKTEQVRKGYQEYCLALAGVAQWIECWPGNHRVTVSTPSQGTCLGCGPVPSRGHVRSKHILMFLSFSFSLLSPPSENK